MSVIQASLNPTDQMKLDGAWARIEQIHQTAAADSRRLNEAADRLKAAYDQFGLVAATTIEAVELAKTASTKADDALEAVELVERESQAARAVLDEKISATHTIAMRNQRRLSGIRARRLLHVVIGLAVGFAIGLAVGRHAGDSPKRQTHIVRMP